MLDQVAGMLALILAVLFYAIAAYHLSLISAGLRRTRNFPLPFHKGSLRNPVDLPKVSLIIPARDEEAVIRGAIQCADALDYPRGLLEIIVVEDGSTDETPGIARRMEPEVKNLIALTGGETKGKPAALNRALRFASGELIAVFDSDTRYEQDLLLRVAKFFHDHPGVAVAQAYPEIANSETNVITRLNAIEMHAWFRGMQAAKSERGLFVHIGGTGMFIRRDVFQTVGQWDENALTEDLEFSLRLARAGVKVAMLPAPVRIQPTYTARDLLHQRRRWWGGALQVARKALRPTHGESGSLFSRVDRALYLSAPLFFFIGSVSFFASIGYMIVRLDFTAAASAWVLGLLSSNLVLAPLVVAQAVRSRRPRLLLLLPGLYVYWMLQLVSFLWALGSVVVGSRIPWVRTPKRKLD